MEYYNGNSPPERRFHFEGSGFLEQNFGTDVVGGGSTVQCPPRMSIHGRVCEALLYTLFPGGREKFSGVGEIRQSLFGP